MYALKRFFAQSPKHYIGAVILAAAVGAFRFAMLAEGVDTRWAVYEVLSVSGFVTFLIGMLLTVAYFGAFDLFSYVFAPGRMGDMPKYKNYAEYSHHKAQKRARGGYYFVPYYVVGIAVVLVSYGFSWVVQ